MSRGLAPCHRRHVHVAGLLYLCAFLCRRVPTWQGSVGTTNAISARGRELQKILQSVSLWITALEGFSKAKLCSAFTRLSLQWWKTRVGVHSNTHVDTDVLSVLLWLSCEFVVKLASTLNIWSSYRRTATKGRSCLSSASKKSWVTDWRWVLYIVTNRAAKHNNSIHIAVSVTTVEISLVL
jgi:hypothetical protein